MKRVQDYVVIPKYHFSIDMPIGAQILMTFGEDRVIYIRTLIKIGNPVEIRNFRIVGTGQEFEESSGRITYNYVGSFQTDGGDTVGHIFEIIHE